MTPCKREEESRKHVSNIGENMVSKMPRISKLCTNCLLPQTFQPKCRVYTDKAMLTQRRQSQRSDPKIRSAQRAHQRSKSFDSSLRMQCFHLQNPLKGSKHREGGKRLTWQTNSTTGGVKSRLWVLALGVSPRQKICLAPICRS